MIWCRFANGDRSQYGIVEDGEVVVAVDGGPFGGHVANGERHPLAEVRLLAPVIPSVFFCVGLNYRAHIAHAAALGNPAATIPERPEIGYRANNALTGHEAEIVAPADLESGLEAEPEAVAVIGRRVRNASREEAAEAIFGWTLGNDVSARLWQRSDRTFWRAKNSDTFKPMGPWIDTGATPMGATTTLTVNGKDVATFATDAMIFDAVDYIVEITKYVTMSPGDVLWMGADATAAIGPGDTVEVSVSGIGTLRNRVVRAASEPSLTWPISPSSSV